MASSCRPARAPDDVAMLAHELRRPMAAVALLRDQGRDITPMLDLLLGEVGDLDAPATDVLGDRRGPAGQGRARRGRDRPRRPHRGHRPRGQRPRPGRRAVLGHHREGDEPDRLDTAVNT